MVRTGWALACVVWLGCAPEETYRSGSRLQFQWLAAEDGAKVFSGFYDTELGFPCRPSRMTDGVVRCVPTLEITRGIGLLTPVGPTERFGDDQCTDRLWAWSENLCAPVPRLTSLRQGEGCAAADVVFEVGDVVPAGELFMRVGDRCERDPGTLGLPPQRRLTVFDPSKLITLDETEVTLGPLRAVLGRSRDGASVVLQLRDGATGAQCTPTSLDLASKSDGPVACMPAMSSTLGPTSLFTGPTCNAPAVQSFVWPQCEGASPATPKVVRVFEQSDSCETTPSEFFELGARVERPYEQSLTCDPVSAFLPTYELGQKIDPRRFPPVNVTVSGATLQTSSWRVADRVVSLPSHFWLDGKPCSVTEFSDGVMRCVPSSAFRGGYLYADPACTRLAFPGWEFACNAPEYLVEVERQSCSSRATRVFRAGAKLSGARLFLKTDQPAGCVEQPQSSIHVWEAGEEVTPSLFPPVTAVAR